MAFTRSAAERTDYASPGELYRDLPRRPGAVPGLWAHQSEVLNTFTSQADKPDVALELPTGTGKTLIGLLIAEWTRRKRRSRIIYACPTQQLARQVEAAAHREGIKTALLIGKHTDWPSAARTAYEAAQVIAVTTYSSIFNSNPQLAEADLVLFDDAHAGGQYVGEAYSLNLNRDSEPTEYQTILDAIAPALDEVFLAGLRASDCAPGIRRDVRMVVPLRQPDMVAKLDAALRSFSEPHKFRYAMIRQGIASCLVYVAYSGILVRPYLPPTHQNQLFSGARQRAYLSATLGEDGELERAFGRARILRLKQLDESTAPRCGRRFFVFPEFANNTDADDLSRKIVKTVGKALILAPDNDTAMRKTSELAQPGWPVLGINQVAESMTTFTELDHGVCGLAARYDGIDLPGDDCRLVGLDGIPNKSNLQERFLESRARAGSALAARVRTRIVQGAGRCTRGSDDFAVVLILGSDLSRYLTRPEVEEALDSELRAEIRFGRENSENGGAENMLENIRHFLFQNQTETWREQAEPTLTDYRHEMAQQTPKGATALSKCVEKEIQAWAAATTSAWADAAKHAHEVASITDSAATKGYQTFWIYLEAVWTDQAADDTGNAVGRTNAKNLVLRAEQIMGLAPWVRQMAPFPTMQRSKLNAPDANAVNQVANKLKKGVKQVTFLRHCEGILANLGERNPSKYEPALTELGELVGADATKPTDRGRCDSTWCWGNELWLALEAKSDHEPTGTVPHKDIRQANDQLRLLAKDRSVNDAPPESATIIISPKPRVHSDGITGAEQHVHCVAPPTVSEMASDVVSAWKELLPKVGQMDLDQLRELVADTFNAHGVLPSQIHERLTHDPVAAKGE